LILDAPPPSDDLRAQAAITRPDLRALELSVQAAALRAKWERSRVAALGVMLSSKEVGTSGVLTGPGVSADIPVFGSHKGGVARADAEVEQAARQYIALRQRVDVEVVEAYAGFAQARESFVRWHDRIVPAAQDVVQASRRAYETGDVSFLAVLEASRLWKDATLREIDLAAAARQAAADLDRSVGTRVTRGPRP
jgi:cobalt-zinc-cadmium efflux system outer membrane protein